MLACKNAREFIKGLTPVATLAGAEGEAIESSLAIPDKAAFREFAPLHPVKLPLS